MIKYYFYGMLKGFKEVQKTYLFDNMASVKAFQKHTIYTIEDAVWEAKRWINILKSINPDEESENHYDSNIILSLK